MQTRVIRVLATALWISCLASGSATGDAQAKEPFTSLTLQVTTDRPTYLVGEAVTLTVRLSNQTSAVISGNTVLGRGFGYLHVLVAFDGLDFKRYRAPEWGIKDALLKPTDIASGHEISETVTLLYNLASTLPGEIPGVLAFPEPGHYAIVARFLDLDSKTRIESQPIHIDVEAPRGVDARAWEMLNNKNAIYFLHTGNSRGDAALEQGFAELLERYPQSRYVDQVRKRMPAQSLP